MMQIVSTTDGRFIGREFDPDKPMVFDGFSFYPDKVQAQPDGSLRLSNSNYVIDAQEID
jgi:hypothetical protein